jgi:5-methylcytosine-specific restriction endonuclease McrBC regulatory subunit McrC
MIYTVDGFLLKDFQFEVKSKEKKINDNYYFEYTAKSDIEKNIHITFKDYKDKQNIFFDLQEDKSKDDDDLIISLSNYDKDVNKFYTAYVGNFIGKFTYNKVDINIRSRFSDTFLKRMLNFANDVFLDDVSVFEAEDKKTKDLDYSKFIIYYMFIQKLEKAFLLGLPKAYKSIDYHEMKVKGKIDINRFIKYDIPFRGKVSSSSREQKEIQEIIDVLYKAINIIAKEGKKNDTISTKNISHIKTYLKQNRSNKYVSNETIRKALKSKALQNPIFTPYKKVLEYAKTIINANNLEEDANATKETFGFLVNVADLFEIYLLKLLRHRMPDWNIEHEPEINIYKDNFYSRKILPDIVMTNDNKVMVFDAKYKRMTFKKGIGDGGHGDLDRSDFFQIHSYMSYYANQKNTILIAGGLLYPIEEEFDENIAHSAHWLENENTKFIVDGIDLLGITDSSNMEDIRSREDSFIKRIKNISGEN